MSVCKCCGQTLPPTDPPLVKLSPMQERIYRTVRAAGPRGIGTEQLVGSIYTSADGGPDYGIKSVQVAISQMNRRLREVNEIIKAASYGGCGPGTYTLRTI